MRPGLVLNSRSAAFLLERQAEDWRPSWTRLRLKVASPNLLDKEAVLAASDLCFHHARTGSEGCLREVDIRLAVRLWPPRLVRVDRFTVLSERMRLVAAAPDPARAPGPAALSVGLPAPLRGSRWDGVRVEVSGLELISGPRAARGNLSVALDASRERPLTARADLSVAGRPLTVSASAAFDAGRADLEASGRWAFPSPGGGPARLVELAGCRGSAGPLPAAGPQENLQLDCAVRVQTGLAAGRTFAVPQVRGRAALRARLREQDMFDARAAVDLDPVEDWYEASASLRVRAEGRLGRLHDARLSHELEGRVAVARFEDLVRRSEGTELAVPGILRPLRGPLELRVKGSGDPRQREQRFFLRGRSTLAEGSQRLAVSAAGELTARDPLLASRELSARGEIVFDDVALELGRLGSGGLAAPAFGSPFPASSTSTVARLRGRAAVSASLARGDHFTALASVDLGPVRDWYEASGRLRLRVEGRLGRLREARIAQELEARLEVPRFEDVVARLHGGALAVPAPFNVLLGPAALDVRGTGDPGGKVQHFELNGRASLAAGRQRLALTAAAEVSLREALRPSRKASVKAEVVLEDVALELPRLELGAAPDVTLDPRIAASTVAPSPAAARASAWEIEARIKTAKPALLYSNLAKQPVPVGVDLSVQNAPRRLAGRIWLERFETELFRRTATVEHFRAEPTPGGAFELDGLLLYKSAEATVRILVLGSSAKPRVELASDPPLERAQIIALLLFNKAPEQLDADQSESVGHAQSALAANAFGLASLYLFASTPVEYVGYDPVDRAYTLRLRVPGGATVELGTSRDESKHVRLRKRLAPRWALQTEMRTREREGNIVTTFLEWFNRF